MFKIESYVTPILLSYVDKYVRDFKPADAQVSLWGGGVALHNLVLKADVLQKEVALPFTLVSGRIHELLIQVPWIKIMSEPIVVTIDTIECVLSMNPDSTPEDNPPPESPSRKTQVVEAPPGYMQALVRRIVSNIAVKVHHLIVKYVQDDVVLSLNVKHLAINSAGTDWKPSFADIDQKQPIIRRLVQLDDLTLCLDRADADGKIRFFQEPLLYRCQLDLRILTKLKSATSRRASSLSIELRSARLAWGVTSDQLILLLRLLRERHVVEKTQIPTSKPSNINQATPLHCPSITDTSDPNREESWSEWAWSWLPAWSDRDSAVDTSPLPAAPIPVMELDGANRKRARSILELHADFAAITCAICAPTLLNIKGGTRNIVLKSQGKCVCGHVDENAIIEEPTIYLSTSETDNKKEDWQWPELNFAYEQVDEAEVAEEINKPEEAAIDQHSESQNVQSATTVEEQKETKDTADDFWRQMNPLLFLEFSHERSPPSANTNPYENPPTDFEYSDWVEQSNIKIKLQSLDLRLCMGLFHRVSTLNNILHELPPMQAADTAMRTLTVEECDALLDNLPQRCIELEFNNLRLRMHPWNHSLNERPIQTHIVLDLKFPKSNVIINSPLYPIRVCSAACQIPDQASPIWNCARLHITAIFEALEAQICSLHNEQPKPCARIDMQLVTHVLLNQALFVERHTILYSYSLKIREANISGSSARLQCAFQIILSCLCQRISEPLRLTTLAKDGLHDEDAVVLDITIEDFLLRGYITSKIKTHIITMQSARATVFHRDSENELKQAWLFSAPDVSTITPYLRVASQWCSEKFQGSLDFFGIWTEPTVVCIDPLFVAWLAYRPYLLASTDSTQSVPPTKSMSSTQYLLRRRITPSSSSGRGHSQIELSAEQVHVRQRSIDSSSEHSEVKHQKNQPQTAQISKKWWQDSEKLLDFYESLRHLLLSAELGLVLVYVTTKTASAVDCPTIRQAMEEHATDGHSVLALSVGRWNMHSTTTTKNLWRNIKHDGPTFVAETHGSATESFPWRMRLADVSCYILEARVSNIDSSSLEKSLSGLRSQLKVTQNKVKYFTSGNDFKPTTLKEFVRGPDRKKKDKASAATDQSERKTETSHEAENLIRSGPIVSFGIHLHADTPPIIIRLDQDQVYIVGSTIHCLTHLINIIGRSPMVAMKKNSTYSSMVLGPRKSTMTRSSEIDEIESVSESDNEVQPDLISIFEAHHEHETVKMKTIFWFQWVISRITVVISNYKVKLALELDDIINTVDLQEHYNQLRIKIASASVKHFEKTENNEWAAGILGGRVLEVREPTHAQEDTHFLSVTITQAQISNLPDSWKDELHPKVLEQKNITDSTWEIFATLAPLEAILQPSVLNNIIALVQDLGPLSSCPLRTEVARKPIQQYPFCYLNAGGLRLLVTCKDLDEIKDDTFMICFGKVTVNPHPDNPVCRKPINAVESSTTLSGIYHGQQYELFIENFSIKSAQFTQIVNQEISESEVLTAENPACKWNQAIPLPVITPVIYSVDIGCIVAPPLYTNGILICGSALELNLMSDCTIDLSLEQILLIRRLVDDLQYSSQDRGAGSSMNVPSFCEHTLFTNHPYRENSSKSNINVFTKDDEKVPSAINQYQTDSGVDTTASQMSIKSETFKKNVTVAFAESSSPHEHFEIFFTMGVVELMLFTFESDNPLVTTLKLPTQVPLKTIQVNLVEESKDPKIRFKELKRNSGTSITEIARTADEAATDLTSTTHSHLKIYEKIPILHVRLQQPNLYYWRKRGVRTMQVSVFNLLINLDKGSSAMQNDLVLMTTAQGLPEPHTGIPPALITMKCRSSTAGSLMISGSNVTSRGNIRIDMERPVLLQASTNKLRRLKIISNLLENTFGKKQKSEHLGDPLLYKLRASMARIGIDSVTIQTSQIGVSGSEGTAGWDSSSLQVAVGARPDRLVLRGLLAGLLVSVGSQQDERQPMLHPLQLGLHSEIIWEAWRRVESGLSPQEPIIYMCIDFDRINVDVRPTDLNVINNLKKSLMGALSTHQTSSSSSDISVNMSDADTQHLSAVSFSSSLEKDLGHESSTGVGNHYYKDDLRSGAFKIVSGGQLPMAYQVTLHQNSVSWRYPHPRAINRLVAFPLPGYDSEIQCVLELYHQLLGRWEPHSYFCLPVDEPREIEFHVSPPEAVFSTMWRYRVCSDTKQRQTPFQFDVSKYMPRADPLTQDIPEPEVTPSVPDVSAQELSGVLRVDSYFAPCLLSRVRVTIRMASLDVHVHNSLPNLISQSTLLEGYYVSKPLMRSHRVLTISARDTTVFSDFGSPAGMLFLLSSELSCDILDCATGAMEQLIPEFRAHFGAGIPDYESKKARLRLLTSNIHMAIHVPRLLTLKALVTDWQNYIKKHTTNISSNNSEDDQVKIDTEMVSVPTLLEGRVSLWIHNSCSTALRVGQEDTDENLPLGPGVKMAYRWRNPSAAKNLRFAFINSSTDWHWSNSVPFTMGTNYVSLEDTKMTDSGTKLGVGSNIYVNVKESGTKRNMRLSGRLTLANMLKFGLYFKIRERPNSSEAWGTVSSGVLEAESIGRSVVCASHCDMVLKIRFVDYDSGWSGDIPLRECPKENVPWLVKVPSEGELPYVSVWCRVICARSDGRILAAIWPFYVLRSHLPLDTDVLVATEPVLANTEETCTPPPRIQAAAGRGATTQLLVPGTTSARHTLSFQYRNLECPVTREAAPLHYGVTDTSVFEKQTPVFCLDEVINEVETWLEKSNRQADSSWPYSLVTKHWPGSWQPAVLQPRCDVVVRYQAVYAGGGCSLEVHLDPVVLLCNASTLGLTLRAHDATPLCKLEPGTAVAPPSVILTKPFFISVEEGRETFVSGQLEITTTEPGRYGALLPGQLAVDHSSPFAVQCNHEVALLTMYYEIKENINVLGITSTFIIYNRLNTDILVSTAAVPSDAGEYQAVPLNPKTLKLICVSKDNNPCGVPIRWFWLRNRWNGDNPAELRTYLSLALPTPSDAVPAQPPVPVPLGQAASRRAIALTDVDHNSLPVVVTQHKHESRWIITVASDPCPQFIIYNHTHYNLAIAIPKEAGEEASVSYIKAYPECQGVRWWFTIGPEKVKHYTPPTFGTRHPNSADVSVPITFFVFGQHHVDEIEPEWSAPVAIAHGEQFLQIHHTDTIKLRVRMYPHSSLVELRGIDQNDISASEIRKRLLNPFPSDESLENLKKIQPSCSLERVNADDKLLLTTRCTKTSINETNDFQSKKQSIVQTHSTTSLQGFTHSKVTNEDDVPTKLSQGAMKIKKVKETIAMPVFIATDNEQAFSSDIPLVATDISTSLQPEESSDKITNKVDFHKPDPYLKSKQESVLSLARVDTSTELASVVYHNGNTELDYSLETERFRCVVGGICIQMAVAGDTQPLLAFHADRAALIINTQVKKIVTTLTIADVQIDNLQYDSGQYDFGVVATTRAEPLETDEWPAIWNMFADHVVFTSLQSNARVVVTTCNDRWNVFSYNYNELTEVVIKLGPLALYIEDAYVTAMTELYRLAVPHKNTNVHDLGLTQAKILQCPIRLRSLRIHSLDLTLTLHTAMRMYIALDQSPLHLSAFQLQNITTSLEHLVHELTVHYLSATILGAGWVVGGLELLGAPGALASRVGGATGGVRGIASATAAALVRSLSALAGSLARNLDLLVGDEEHAKRAAAARRRPPDSLVAGLTAGFTNFAINILGAVGGLAHHPLVSVAVGEAESSTTALRRGLLGAVAKPLSATADLVAFAGHGLLRQTGWDPVPNPRPSWEQKKFTRASWRRDCVRWTFRLSEMNTFAGFEVLFNDASLLLLLTHKFLVVADPEAETVIEMIDLRFCSLKPYNGENVELCVTQTRNKNTELRADEDDEYQISAAAMARVARFTGTEDADNSESRILTFIANSGQSLALYAALEAAIHYNSEAYFSLL